LYNQYFKRIRGPHGTKPLVFCPSALDNRKEVKEEKYPILNVAGVRVINFTKRTVALNKNPYDLENKEYYDSRRIEFARIFSDIQRHKLNLLKKQKGLCSVCNKIIDFEDKTEIDHIVPLSKNGKHEKNNLRLVH